MKRYIIFILLIILTSPVFGLGSGNDNEESSKERKTESLIIEPDINYWGMNADISIYGFEIFKDLSSRVLVSGGAGIRSLGYYRDENDEFIEEDDGSRNVYSDFTQLRIHTNWGVALTQGIINREGFRNDLLYAELRYRGIREWNIEDSSREQIIFNSIRPDRDGILLNSLIAALVYDCVSKDEGSGNLKGFYSEISVERGPEWFFNDIEGDSDFIKYYGSFSLYIPAADIRNRSGETSSGIYIADCFSADLVDGNKIPLIARQTMGSLDPKNGLGGTVRGFESRRFDGELTLSNNLETRLTLPVIGTKLFRNRMYLRPGIFTFFDSGYYDLLDGTDAGFLLSCGGGIFGDINGIVQGMAYLSFPLEGERLDEKAMDLFTWTEFAFLNRYSEIIN